MAVQIDQINGDFIINGFQNGIGDSPYTGLTDARNVNITSVPSEADVNFATDKISSPAVTGSVISVSGTTYTFSGGAGLENRMAIYFTSLGSYSGIAEATPYWVGNLSGSTFQLYSDYNQANAVTITGTGTANFAAYQIGIEPSYVTSGGGPVTYFARPTNITASSYYTFCVDSTGLVWSDFYVTGTNSYWTYTGNAVTGNSFPDDNGATNASGNGLVYWRVSNNATGITDITPNLHTVDYLFVFRNSQMDFFVVNSYSGGPQTGLWTYGWNPNTGTTGQSSYFVTPVGTDNSHMAIVSTDGRVYFCDAWNVNQLYQTNPDVLFNPFSGDKTTFTYTTFPLLPINDIAQCLAPLGLNMLIGGQGNVLYQWDTFSTLTANNIIMPESFVASIITVNANAYIFLGNRGRIYITNGSQLQLWKKLPDHLSNTIEPYYRWGGTCYNKDQLFCSFSLTQNSGAAITTMGGVWAIDTNTLTMRLANQLSYGTYAGYASAMISEIYNPTVSVNAPGAALFIGWYDGTTNYGLDATTSNLYTAGQSYIVSDMIPIGTAIMPTTPGQIEFKLAAPLVSGEQVEIQVGQYLTGPFTSVQVFPYVSGLTTISGITTTMPIQEFQWLLVKAILTGTNTNPSYVRLTEMRVKGAATQQTGYYNT